MAISEMRYDRAADCVQSPTWEEVQSAIYALDGMKNDHVILYGPGGEDAARVYLTFGGNSSSGLCCFLVLNNRNYLRLGKSVDDTEVSLMVGGQEVPVRERNLIDQHEALLIARDFLSNKLELADGSKWEPLEVS